LHPGGVTSLPGAFCGPLRTGPTRRLLADWCLRSGDTLSKSLSITGKDCTNTNSRDLTCYYNSGELTLLYGNTYILNWYIGDGDTDEYTLKIEEKDYVDWSDHCVTVSTTISSRPFWNTYRFTLPSLHDMDCADDGGASFPEFRIELKSDCDYGYTPIFRVAYEWRQTDTTSLISDKDYTVRNDAHHQNFFTLVLVQLSTHHFTLQRSRPYTLEHKPETLKPKP